MEKIEAARIILGVGENATVEECLKAFARLDESSVRYRKAAAMLAMGYIASLVPKEPSAKQKHYENITTGLSFIGIMCSIGGWIVAGVSLWTGLGITIISIPVCLVVAGLIAQVRVYGIKKRPAVAAEGPK